MSARLWSLLWPEPELQELQAVRIIAGRPNPTIQQAEEAGLSSPSGLVASQF